MRVILFLLCISCVTISVKAQTFGDSDVEWNTGYYYDLDGTKVTGLIDRNYLSKNLIGTPIAIFKKDKSAESKVIDPNIISRFVCGPDSFTVCHTLNPGKYVFIKVLMNEPVKLYEADKRKVSTSVNNMFPLAGMSLPTGVFGFSTLSVYGAPHLYYGPDADHLMELTKKNFKEAMNAILVKRPELLAKVNSREYEYDDLENLVNYYNGMRMEETRVK